jgi:propanediol utilization protein
LRKRDRRQQGQIAAEEDVAVCGVDGSWAAVRWITALGRQRRQRELSKIDRRQQLLAAAGFEIKLPAVLVAQ